MGKPAPRPENEEPHEIVVHEVVPPLSLEAPRAPDDNSPEALMRLTLEKAGTPTEAVAVLERLVALKERAEALVGAKLFAEAMAAFQEECPPIRKNKTGNVATDSGTKFGYTYAELPMIALTIRPFLHKHGLSYSWSSEVLQGSLTVICTVKHIAGHSESSSATLPVASKAGMSDQQRVASALKFGQRLSLVQVLGITTADADMDGMDVAGIGPTISATEAAEVTAKLKEADVSVAKFLLALKVGAVEEIPANLLGLAFTMIEETVAARAKKAAKKPEVVS